MKMTITAEFFNDQTPEEAVASLAKHLMESIVWRGPAHAVVELRGLTADVTMDLGTLPNFPASAPINVEEYDPNNERRNRFMPLDRSHNR